MRTKIVRIGNSQGIRIPKILLNDSRLEKEVDLLVCEEGILIRPAKNPREKWEAFFEEMSDNDADEMIVDEPGLTTGFEKDSWRW